MPPIPNEVARVEHHMPGDRAGMPGKAVHTGDNSNGNDSGNGLCH